MQLPAANRRPGKAHTLPERMHYSLGGGSQADGRNKSKGSFKTKEPQPPKEIWEVERLAQNHRLESLLRRQQELVGKWYGFVEDEAERYDRLVASPLVDSCEQERRRVERTHKEEGQKRDRTEMRQQLGIMDTVVLEERADAARMAPRLERLRQQEVKLAELRQRQAAADEMNKMFWVDTAVRSIGASGWLCGKPLPPSSDPRAAARGHSLSGNLSPTSDYYYNYHYRYDYYYYCYCYRYYY